jgi:2Fe-2S ferredoxin
MEEDEEAMLSEAFNVTEKSRLSCQISITNEIEGLEVTIAPEE